MTEVEKLRALLAEARMYLTMNGGSADDRIVRRIDAALAEPVEVHPSNLTTILDVLETERDEARAEVAAAYRRGAEAMREAAAVFIERNIDPPMMRFGLAEDMRDLPVPEGKP